MDYHVIERITRVAVADRDLRVLGRTNTGEGRTVAPVTIEFSRVSPAAPHQGVLVVARGPKVKADGSLTSAYYEVRCAIGDVGTGSNLPAAPGFIETMATEVGA